MFKVKTISVNYFKCLKLVPYGTDYTKFQNKCEICRKKRGPSRQLDIDTTITTTIISTIRLDTIKTYLQQVLSTFL